MKKKRDVWRNLTKFFDRGASEYYELTNQQLKIITGSRDRRLKPDFEIPEDNEKYTIGKWAERAGFCRKSPCHRRNGIVVYTFERRQQREGMNGR